MKKLMKIAAQFAYVLGYPLMIIAIAGILSFALCIVTDMGFYEISHNPFVWVISGLIVTIAYIYASGED